MKEDEASLPVLLALHSEPRRDTRSAADPQIQKNEKLFMTSETERETASRSSEHPGNDRDLFHLLLLLLSLLLLLLLVSPSSDRKTPGSSFFLR